MIETREQLVSVMAKGEKPAERWRIGTEHEKFVYCTTVTGRAATLAPNATFAMVFHATVN